MKIRSVLFVVLCACGGSESVTPVDASRPLVSKPTEIYTAPAPAPVAIAAPPPIETLAATPSTYGDAMSEGKAMVAKGEQVKARELFEAAAKLDRKRAEPHVELARSFIATGDRAKAVAAATKAIKLAPDSTGAWNTLGRAELARKGYDAAITAFRKAVELDRDNAWAWNNLGFVELEVGRYADAVEPLEQATSRAGATGYMWNNLGTAYEQLDRLDDARDAFAKGGALGSGPAVASRKRLEGVKTLAVAAPAPTGSVKIESVEVQETVPVDAGVPDAAVAPVAPAVIEQSHPPAT